MECPFIFIWKKPYKNKYVILSLIIRNVFFISRFEASWLRGKLRFKLTRMHIVTPHNENLALTSKYSRSDLLEN